MRRSVKAALTRWHGSPVTEAVIQRAIVKLLHVMQNQGLLRFGAIPNGGSRNVIEAANMKRTGTVAGIPDLCVFLPGGRTLWIEVKSAKGTLSRAQRDWAEWLLANGHRYAMVRSFDEFEAVLKREMHGHV